MNFVRVLSGSIAPPARAAEWSDFECKFVTHSRDVLRQGNSIATCRYSRFFQIVSRARGGRARYSIYREIVVQEELVGFVAGEVAEVARYP